MSNGNSRGALLAGKLINDSIERFLLEEHGIARTKRNDNDLIASLAAIIDECFRITSKNDGK